MHKRIGLFMFRFGYITTSLLLYIQKGEYTMFELKDTIIESIGAVFLALSGMLIAYLHAWTKRIKEKDRHINKLEQKLVSNECKLEALQQENKEDRLNKVVRILENLEQRITKLERVQH